MHLMPSSDTQSKKFCCLEINSSTALHRSWPLKSYLFPLPPPLKGYESYLPQLCESSCKSPPTLFFGEVFRPQLSHTCPQSHQPRPQCLSTLDLTLYHHRLNPKPKQHPEINMNDSHWLCILHFAICILHLFRIHSRILLPSGPITH